MNQQQKINKYKFLNKSYYSFFSVVLVLVPLIIGLIINLNRKDVDQNLDQIEISQLINGSKCDYSSISLINYFKTNEIDYQHIDTSVSYFPDISKSECYLKVEKYEIDEFSRNKIYTTTSYRLVNYLESFNLFLLFFLLKQGKFNHKTNLSLIFLNQVLIELVFGYFKNGNLITIQFLIKLFLILNLFHFFINFKKLNNKFLLFIITLFTFIKNEQYQLKVDDRIEIFYFTHAFKSSSNESVIIGNNHTEIYSYLVNFFYILSGSYYKFVLELVLTVWASYLIFLLIRDLKINPLVSLLLASFILFRTNLIGGEGFLTSVLPKNYSYLLIFSACYFLYKRRINFSILFYSLSFYFHFAMSVLFLPVYIYIYIVINKTHRIVMNTSKGILLVFPYLIYLYQNIYRQSSEVKNYEELKRQFILTYQNHLYPFVFENGKFVELNLFFKSLPQIVLIIFIVFILYLLNKNKDIKFLGILSFVSLIFLFYIFVMYLFPFSDFVLLHPFRFVTFFSISIFIFLSVYLDKYSELYEQSLSIVCILIIFLTVNQPLINPQVNSNYTKYFTDKDLKIEKTISTPDELVNYLSVQEVDLILTPLTNTQSIFNDLEMKTGIPNYVNLLHIPLNINELNEWNERKTKLNSFYNEKCEVFDDYSNFLFVDYVNNNQCGELVKSFDGYYLYSRK